jgi:hypothetical protein
MGVLALTPGPSPAPLIPRKRGLWERGDSGERVRHLRAVDGHDEHFFGPPLIPKWERGNRPHQEAAHLAPNMGAVRPSTHAGERTWFAVHVVGADASAARFA